MIIGSEKTIMTQLDNLYFDININCNHINYSNETDIAEEFSSMDLLLRNKTKTFCFCYNKLQINYTATIDYQIYKFPNILKPCTEITEKILVYQSISFGISIIIPALNSIMVIVLRCK